MYSIKLIAFIIIIASVALINYTDAKDELNGKAAIDTLGKLREAAEDAMKKRSASGSITSLRDIAESLFAPSIWQGKNRSNGKKEENDSSKNGSPDSTGSIQSTIRPRKQKQHKTDQADESGLSIPVPMLNGELPHKAEAEHSKSSSLSNGIKSNPRKSSDVLGNSLVPKTNTDLPSLKPTKKKSTYTLLKFFFY